MPKAKLFINHGTTHSYRFYECRCEACRQAVADCTARYRQRAREEQRASYLTAIERQRQRYREYPKSVCQDCGAVTSTNGARVSKRCFTCAMNAVGAARRAHGPRPQAILKALEQGPLPRKQISAETGLNINHISSIMPKLIRWGLVKRVERGVYQLVSGDEQS